jgi:hypothetical protein
MRKPSIAILAVIGVVSLLGLMGCGSSTTTLRITTTSLPNGEATAPYSENLTACGGSGSSSSWAITSGTLPGGLSLNNTTGLISGTPTTSGTSGFTVKVTDSKGGTASENLSINIAADLVGTSLSVNGLKLSLSLNSTTLQPGQELSIVVDEQNTLPVANNVLSSRNWPLNGLSVGPCGTLNYPFGVAIFQGYYSSADVSEATPLMLYDPSAGYFCPMILSEITAYVFQPSSDTAAIFGSCDPNPCFTTKINTEVTATGYWTGGPSPTLTNFTPGPGVYTNFTPGVYTIVAGDEWGTLAVLHFVVSG